MFRSVGSFGRLNRPPNIVGTLEVASLVNMIYGTLTGSFRL